MSTDRRLNGLYVITDDKLTPNISIYEQVEKSLKGGASIVQLRDKKSTKEAIKTKAIKLQSLCHKYNALFVLNDKVDLAIEIDCDGLHIGESDYSNFSEIRERFKGIIGVSCYGNIEIAKSFEEKGADYIAFGSFFASPTKPDSKLIPLDILSVAKSRLDISICAIGGINSLNVGEIVSKKPHLISLVSDIWKSSDIEAKSNFYANQF